MKHLNCKFGIICPLTKSSNVKDKDFLMIEVCDWDVVGRDSQGSAEISVSFLMELKKKGKSSDWFPLHLKGPTGDILISFTFDPEPYGNLSTMSTLTFLQKPVLIQAPPRKT